MVMSNVLAHLSWAHVRSAKRGPNERKGVHAWHSYYAGYSEGFVEDALHELLGESKNGVVLDPWNGSGTTTLVAQRLGYRSLGVEINPVMVTFANAKNLTHTSAADDLVSMSKQVRETAISMIELDHKNLRVPEGWRTSRSLMELAALRDAIVRICSTGNRDETDFPILMDRCQVRPYYQPMAAFLMAGVLQAVRSTGHFTKGSNPTWVAINDDVTSEMRPIDEFPGIIERMIRELTNKVSNPEAISSCVVLEGNSKSLPILSESIDAIVTSPPYLTRIDYAVSTKPELLLLGLAEDGQFDAIRRGTMGAPVVVEKGLEPNRVWGEICYRLITEAIPNHPAKASRSYYLPTFLQYFRDAERSVLEIRRVLKPGAKAAIVVQSSYFKEHEIPLGKIYVEMAQNLGLQAQIVRSEEVRGHMAHVNTASSVYVRNKVYYEDVVLIGKPSR